MYCIVMPRTWKALTPFDGLILADIRMFLTMEIREPILATGHEKSGSVAVIDVAIFIGMSD